MSIRSYSAPGQPSRSGPAVDAGRAARCTEAVRDIAEDLTVLGEALMHCAYSISAPTTDLLRIVIDLDKLNREAVAALVVRQRSQGEPLGDLALMLERTEDRLRKKYVPQDVDAALTSRSRPMRAEAGPRLSGEVPTTKHLLRQPRQRLACALTRMQSRSGIPQRALAERMNVDPSYISRLLSGERDVSWSHALILVEACDGNSELLKPLWEAAAGVKPTGTDPVRALRAYLRALRYAAGEPSDGAVLASAQHTITPAELDQALDGPGAPVWPVVKQLTTALQSLPEVARPLWRQAHSTGETAGPDAGSFG
ncbi:helix-turn-helix transcriptional regulator [Streptomyces sp. NPDC006649]|uniref:helix-turn-helix domain-containing protein n=1 Tax=Streptomyces sp. NPDC006649 TaxID=3156896 RepID=UPI0033A55479